MKNYCVKLQNPHACRLVSILSIRFSYKVIHWPFTNDLGSRSWHFPGSSVTLLWNSIPIHELSEKLWLGQCQEAQRPNRSPESFWPIFLIKTHAKLLFFNVAPTAPGPKLKQLDSALDHLLIKFAFLWVRSFLKQILKDFSHWNKFECFTLLWPIPNPGDHYLNKLETKLYQKAFM
jgi:hypothetical protein